MKKKYKILIISIMVLSILTCFMITSFAYDTNDIVYNDVTYTFDNKYIEGNVIFVQFENKNNITLMYNNQEITNEAQYNIIKLYYSTNWRIQLYNNDDLVFGTQYSPSNDVYLYYNGNITIKTTNLDTNSYESSTAVSNNLYPDIGTFSIWRINNSFSNGMYVINQIQPNPLDKVNDFLTYLSTSLNKLTTMILANQILILFIVAVPVVSFVIGSFKRIKDSGRV